MKTIKYDYAIFPEFALVNKFDKDVLEALLKNSKRYLVDYEEFTKKVNERSENGGTNLTPNEHLFLKIVKTQILHNPNNDNIYNVALQFIAKNMKRNNIFILVKDRKIAEDMFANMIPAFEALKSVLTVNYIENDRVVDYQTRKASDFKVKSTAHQDFDNKRDENADASLLKEPGENEDISNTGVLEEPKEGEEIVGSNDSPDQDRNANMQEEIANLQEMFDRDVFNKEYDYAIPVEEDEENVEPEPVVEEDKPEPKPEPEVKEKEKVIKEEPKVEEEAPKEKAKEEPKADLASFFEVETSTEPDEPKAKEPQVEEVKEEVKEEPVQGWLDDEEVVKEEPKEEPEVKVEKEEPFEGWINDDLDDEPQEEKPVEEPQIEEKEPEPEVIEEKPEPQEEIKEEPKVEEEQPVEEPKEEEKKPEEKDNTFNDFFDDFDF
ncbi:MAG: hypothetical protein K5925_00810 [Bacilli bacterium]|nr:hypothetical protein [Bacilli bacterium]